MTRRVTFRLALLSLVDFTWGLLASRCVEKAHFDFRAIWYEVLMYRPGVLVVFLWVRAPFCRNLKSKGCQLSFKKWKPLLSRRTVRGYSAFFCRGGWGGKVNGSRRIFVLLWYLVRLLPGTWSLRLSPRSCLTASASEIPAGLRHLFVCVLFCCFHKPGIQLPPCCRGSSRLRRLNSLAGGGRTVTCTCILYTAWLGKLRASVWGCRPADCTAKSMHDGSRLKTVARSSSVLLI